MSNWTKPTTAEEAYRRAGGRRRYNAQRQRAAEARRDAIIKYARKQDIILHIWVGQDEEGIVFRYLPAGDGHFVTGVHLAQEFGVSEATMSRDLRAIKGRFDKLMEILEEVRARGANSNGGVR